MRDEQPSLAATRSGALSVVRCPLSVGKRHPSVGRPPLPDIKAKNLLEMEVENENEIQISGFHRIPTDHGQPPHARETSFLLILHPSSFP